MSKPLDCKTALLTLLDQIDYTAGACAPNEMIGAVLDRRVIELCRQAIAAADLPTVVVPVADGPAPWVAP